MFTAIRASLAAGRTPSSRLRQWWPTETKRVCGKAIEMTADPFRSDMERLHHERGVVIALRRRRDLHLADRRTRDHREVVVAARVEGGVPPVPWTVMGWRVPARRGFSFRS